MTEFRERMLAAATYIERAETDDIITLVKIAGLRPETAFRGGDWEDCDFSYQDLRGFDFRGAKLSGARFHGALTAGAQWADAAGAELSAANNSVPLDARLGSRAYNTMIRNARSFREACGIYDLMRRGGVNPDDYTLNLLMAKAETYGQAMHALNLMRGADQQPTVVTYATLISKSVDGATASAWGEEMLARGVRPDRVAINAWMTKIESYADARTLMERLSVYGVTPDDWTFNILIDKVNNYADANAIVEEMRALGIRPKRVTYHSVMNKAPSVDIAMGIMRQMIAEGFGSDNIIYNTMLRLSRTGAEVETVFECMLADGLRPDKTTFNTVLSKARDDAARQRVVDKMKTYGVAPDIYTFNTLLARVKSSGAALDVLRAMLDAKVPVDLVTAATLRNKIALHRGTEAEFDKLLRLKAHPALMVARMAVEASPNVEAAADWVIALTNGIYDRRETGPHAIAIRIHDMAVATAISRTLQEHRIFLGIRYFSTIYRKFAQRHSAEEILNWHFQQKIKCWEALEASIRAFAHMGKPREALRIALGWPFFDASRKVMQSHSALAEEVFGSFLETEPGNAHYAIAFCHLVTGRTLDALASFEAARVYTTNEARRCRIDERIADVRASLDRSGH